MQGEEGNIWRIEILITSEVMDAAKGITVNQTTKGEDGKNVTVRRKLSDIFYERYLKPNESKLGFEIFHIMHDYEKIEFGEVKKIYSSRDMESRKEITNFEVIKTSKDGNGVTLFIKNVPEDGNLTIPSKVYDEEGKEYNVESIGKNKDIDFKMLKNVVFIGDFDSLTIKTKTFLKVKNLKTVNFTGTVKSLTIGHETFLYCEALTNFTIPEGITSLTIEKMAFCSCTALTSFTIPEGVTSLTIGLWAFERCTSLTNFTIPEGITSLTIYGDAFSSCPALTSFTIPDSVQDLKLNSMMLYNSSIEKLYVPEHLKDQIPEDFEGKEKIVLYNIAEGCLELKVNNKSAGELKLNKETLEKFSKSGIQSVRAKNSKDKAFKIVLDADLEGEFEITAGGVARRKSQ